MVYLLFVLLINERRPKRRPECWISAPPFAPWLFLKTTSYLSLGHHPSVVWARGHWDLSQEAAWMGLCPAQLSVGVLFQESPLSLCTHKNLLLFLPKKCHVWLTVLHYGKPCGGPHHSFHSVPATLSWSVQKWHRNTTRASQMALRTPPRAKGYIGRPAQP